MSGNEETGRIWWYKGRKEDRSFVRGPFTWEEVLHRLESGVIAESTMVKRSSEVYWQELSGCLYGKKRSYGPTIAVMVCLATVLLFLFFYVGDKKADQSAGSALVARNATDPERPSWATAAQTAHSNDPLSLQQPGSRNNARPFVPQEPVTKDAIIKLGNDVRASHGLATLAEHHLLDKIAEERLHDMFQKQYIGHVSPSGEQASDHAQRLGYHYKIIAENIASGYFLNNQKVIDGWMQSPGHRQNMLIPDTKEIGVAIDRGQFQGANIWIAVQIFGLQSLPVSAKKRCIAPPQDLYADLESRNTEISNLEGRLSRFKQELDQEITSIEADRKYIGNNGQGVTNLNLRINSYNEKSAWYNSSLADLTAQRAILKSMAEDYNKRVQTYRDCESSGH
jgi:uncharacterized protein YkwD